MPKRRRYATRDELAHRILCNDQVHDLGVPREHVDAVLDTLAGYGVPLDGLVRIDDDGQVVRRDSILDGNEVVGSINVVMGLPAQPVVVHCPEPSAHYRRA